MRFAGCRETIVAPTHGNTSARTAFNADGDDRKPLVLGYVRAAMPSAGKASAIDAPTESQAVRLAARALTLALDESSRTLNGRPRWLGAMPASLRIAAQKSSRYAAG